MREPLRLAILGLPGAGKTTLAGHLAGSLRCRAFSTGEALRALAAVDGSLAAALATGKLASEDLITRLVGEAVAGAGTEALVLDGFPRHAAQADEADRLLGSWVPLLIEVPPELAADRIATRMLPRPEDRRVVAEQRVRGSAEVLARLVRLLEERGTVVLRVSGSTSVADVTQQALRELLAYRRSRTE